MSATEVCDRQMPATLPETARIAPWQKEPALDHLFANNVRFLSMAAVVFIHCIAWISRIAGNDSTAMFERGLRQPVSFDVIGFFLVSGFLMEEQLTRRRPMEYLKRRFHRVLTPWLFWFSLFCSILLISDVILGRFGLHAWMHNAFVIAHRVFDGLFSSIYWFVPNLMISLCILLLCRRFMFNLRLGCILMGISLFYGLDVHAQWFPIGNHTQALFGFVFYLWLGAWASRNFTAIQAWIARTSTSALMMLVVLAGSAAFLESNMLAASGSHNPMNTLRICNQVYAVVLVLLIFKLRRPAWPRFIDVRANTFGIYLIHPILLLLLGHVVNRTMFGPIVHLPRASLAATLLFLSLCCFVLLYGCSLALTKWLLGRPGLRWMVGASGG